MIRQANVADYEEISRICTEDLGYECKKELVKTRIENIDGAREAVFVAVIDGKIIGFLHVEKYKVLYFEDMANILGLAVAREYQHLGYGKALVEASEQWAKNNNIHMLRLNSGIGRTKAHGFYRAIGFLDEKEQKRFMKYL